MRLIRWYSFVKLLQILKNSLKKFILKINSTKIYFVPKLDLCITFFFSKPDF